MHPKIKFKIDARKDINVLDAFIKEVGFDNGRNLEWLVFKKYPELKRDGTRRKLHLDRNEVIEFVRRFYKTHVMGIRKGTCTSKLSWERKEKGFYASVDKLFRDRHWPKGKYIAYTTIWGMFPRFLENKTFCIPYMHKRKGFVNVVIAHEMLHFMFYDYFLKKYPEYTSEKSNEFSWYVSEIFNIVVQNSPAWVKIFGVKCMDYPEHKKIIRMLNKKYYRKSSWDVDELICDIVQAVHTSGLMKNSVLRE